MSRGLTYRDAGVDIEAGKEFVAQIRRHVRSTFGPAVIDNEDGFGGLYAMPGNVGLFARRCKNPVLVASTDGVGTKLKVARRAGVHHTVGIDLVAMCVNDVLVQGALPLFFLDYLATGKLQPAQMAHIVQGIAEGCHQADCALLGGETAEHPGDFAEGAYDLAGFAVGVVERAKMIDGSRKVRPGDVVLGIASTGLHSNGFSLVRKLFFQQERKSLSDVIPELGCTLGEELLRPTRIYVKGVIHALAHITGGGLAENVPRVVRKNCVVCIEKTSWPRPPIFELIQRLGRVDEDEMFRVFNMGIGMVAIVSPYYADSVRRILESRGETVSAIGGVIEGDGPAVELV